MYGMMAKAFTSSNKGKVVLTVWGVTAVTVTLKAVLSSRRRKERKSAKKRTKSKLMKLIKKALKGKRRTMPWVMLLTLSLCAKVVVSVKVSQQIGHLGSLVASRDWAKMFDSQMAFALWCMPAAAVAALTGYSENRLALAFRANMTEELHSQYQACKTMLTAAGKLPNPDQRMTADVEELCNTASKLYAGLVRPLLEVMLVSGTLAHHMGTTELLKCYGWFMASGFWVRWAGPSFRTLTDRVADEEAAFRASHKRIVDYAEEVEMLQGSDAEVGIVRRDFERVRAVKGWFHLQSAVSDALSTYTLRYMGILVAYATMLPAVYNGAPSVADPTEYTLTCLHLLVNVGLAARDLMLGARQYSVASAMAARVDELSECLEVVPCASPAHRSTSEDAITFTDLTLSVPGQPSLISKLNLSVARHEHVFVHGPNGAGKTSLLRMMSGIMEPAAGHLSCPPRSSCFYVPQRAYLIPGTLREQLVYPDTTSANDTIQNGAGSRDLSDEKLLQVLALVNLEQLASTPEQLNATDSCDNLSAGEKQRIGIARLLIHQPMFAMLDECTNSLDEAFEAWVYEYCSKMGITLFTVSHRLALRRYHKSELHLKGDGSWTLSSV